MPALEMTVCNLPTDDDNQSQSIRHMPMHPGAVKRTVGEALRTGIGSARIAPCENVQKSNQGSFNQSGGLLWIKPSGYSSNL
jgi:hypothetical protein